MTSDQRTAYDLIYNEPYMIGHMVGFKDLTPEIHNKWLQMFLTRTDDMTLQGHRGSYKTTTLSLFLAIHAILIPDETVLFFRKTAGDVSEVIRQTGNMLKSGCFRKLAEMIHGRELALIKDSSDEIQTNLTKSYKGTSQLVGLGIGTSITGKHADIVVTDDIVNVTDRASKAEREKTKRAYMELQNVKNRGGRFINTGTPWHENDAFTLMPEPDRYDCYHTGLISPQELQEIKDSMLPSLFAANYELRHIAAEDVIFTNPVTGGDPAKVMQSNYCHIDAAYGGEDFTAFTICRKVEGKYYVFGKLWQKHIEACESEIIEFRKAFNAGKIYIESNADKGFLAKDLRKRGERVVDYWEDMNKFLKITSYLVSEWKNIVFVSGTDEEYIQQITDFNENADHDDAPDSLASIIRILWGKKSEDERRIPYEFL